MINVLLRLFLSTVTVTRRRRKIGLAAVSDSDPSNP